MAGKTYYITTPIYYVNDVPHIGHAYTTIAADVAARFKRLAGYETFFLTGTDEHGINIERAARQHGVTPQAWCDRIAAEFRRLWEVLNIRYDDFIRTTEPRHERVAALLFQKLYDQGDIYPGRYEGWYCASCESFYLETELGPDRTCPVHTGRTTEWTSEESYLFRLSRYQDWWLRAVEENPALIEPEARRNEVVSFVRAGLRDLSVSRSTFTWGVPVPFDRRHVIYVWIDALTNYISALGYPDGERFRRFWPATVHLVGKEIVRFHAVYWPILLHAAGIPIPQQTFAHGWLTFGGQKFSKSLGNVIDPAALAREIAQEAGVDQDIAVDAIRYFLLREIPFGADGDFNKPGLVHRFNADLANDYGNLLNRTLPQIERHFGGVVPPPEPAVGTAGALRRTAAEVVDALDPLLSRLDFTRALAEIWRLLALANKFLDEEAPWRTVRTDRRRAGAALAETVEVLRGVTILLSPWLPAATRRVWDQLGIGVPLEAQRLEDAREGTVPPGTRVRPGAPVFPRIEKYRVEVREAGEAQTGPGPATPPKTEPAEEEPVGETITIEEFRRLDIRVAEVLEAKRVPNTDKLIEARIDLGTEVRTIITGLIPQYTPEELVGKRIIVLANLAPRRVRGVDSHGMLLAAEWDGQVALLTVEKNAPKGAKIT
ncbi:MAG: methionine--tRNA ligase [Armatimonadota bacterium]|nr:methionine--tRNA ligase [Armatimonadota bacterium]MDR7452164.1 methionine--tRNA ligase [Armatimonadota bacterium]MDR7468069.1 methionine--tRNA ligase [Armatimonadota bacterium]MDR7494890.1 methionine--tRNA ligase [Armatimonadota bacterium]MDR7500287.1 methionine--tRNA ligase [Armatimonadota bacterium]